MSSGSLNDSGPDLDDKSPLVSVASDGLPHTLAESMGSDLDLALEGLFLSEKGCWSRVSPGFILGFLVTCQLVNYFDRGAVSGLLQPLGEYFELRCANEASTRSFCWFFVFFCFSHFSSAANLSKE